MDKMTEPIPNTAQSFLPFFTLPFILVIPPFFALILVLSLLPVFTIHRYTAYRSYVVVTLLQHKKSVASRSDHANPRN